MTPPRLARIHLRDGPRDGTVLELSAELARHLARSGTPVEIPRDHRPGATRLTDADVNLDGALDGTVDRYRLDRVTLSPTFRPAEVTMRAHHDGAREGLA